MNISNVKNQKNNYFFNSLKIKIIKIYYFFAFSFFMIFVYYNKIIKIFNKNENKDTKIVEAETENDTEEQYYEKNIDFSEYSTKIKIIALYLPNFLSLQFLDKVKQKYKKHHQPRIPENKSYINHYNLTNYLQIKKQIHLAKTHGIYGFGIYFYWFSGVKLFDEPLNIIYEANIDFHYMIIWKNENVTDENNNILLNEKYEENDPEKFIIEIKKYLLDQKYIRMEGKPIIGLYAPNNIPNLQETLMVWRKKANELGVGEIFIISSLNGRIKDSYNLKLFDAAYKLLPNYLNNTNKNKNIWYNYSYYYTLFYSNIISNEKTIDFPIYNSIILEYDNSPINQNPTIFGEYSPELFYMLNKLLINQIGNNYNQYILINAWNNYFEGTYLEPDKKYGYSSLNALSKALFNLTFKNIKSNISLLINKCLVAVQVHIFYEYLIDEIINKTNNIPVKYDLYITTDTIKKKRFINYHVKKKSKANSYMIKIVKNEGRDVFPLLIQMTNIIKKYKYFCHIHSKISHSFKWRNYLYSNLIGSKELIIEILSDFENHDKLGVIIPESFYDVLQYSLRVDVFDKYLNNLINRLFPGVKIAKKFFEFPAGNMFWARNKAVYQIFKRDIVKEIINQKITMELLYAIERIWLFINKLNGYYYKKYYKYPYFYERS